MLSPTQQAISDSGRRMMETHRHVVNANLRSNELIMAERRGQLRVELKDKNLKELDMKLQLGKQTLEILRFRSMQGSSTFGHSAPPRSHPEGEIEVCSDDDTTISRLTTTSVRSPRRQAASFQTAPPPASNNTATGDAPRLKATPPASHDEATGDASRKKTPAPASHDEGKMDTIDDVDDAPPATSHDEYMAKMRSDLDKIMMKKNRILEEAKVAARQNALPPACQDTATEVAARLRADPPASHVEEGKTDKIDEVDDVASYQSSSSPVVIVDCSKPGASQGETGTCPVKPTDDNKVTTTERKSSLRRTTKPSTAAMPLSTTKPPLATKTQTGELLAGRQTGTPLAAASASRGTSGQSLEAAPPVIEQMTIAKLKKWMGWVRDTHPPEKGRVVWYGRTKSEFVSQLKTYYENYPNAAVPSASLFEK
jgi:hypothetical protein